MKPLIPYQRLYQVLVVATLATAGIGLSATWRFVRARPRSLARVIGFLVVALLLAGIQMVASHQLRGKTAPTNVRLLLTAFTLGLVLLLRLPWVRDRLPATRDAGGPPPGTTPAGLALVLGGILTWTTWLWAGPSHLVDGTNWVLGLQTVLVAGGSGMVLSGMVLVTRARLRTPVAGNSESGPARLLGHSAR
jgi:hypothetical protein